MAKKTKSNRQPRAKAGRPHTLESEEFVNSFFQYVEISGSVPTAILLSGCGRETFFRWQREWEAHQAGKDESAKLSDKLVELYGMFFDGIDTAFGRHKFVIEGHLRSAAEKDWRAGAWWLQRKAGEEYREPESASDKKEAEKAVRIVWVPVEEEKD
jgi:hypothetical protein